MVETPPQLFDKKRLGIRVPELAAALGISAKVVYRLVERREIPFAKVGGTLIFQPEKIEAWLNERSHDAQR